MTASAPGNQPAKPVRLLSTSPGTARRHSTSQTSCAAWPDPPLDDAGQRRASQLGGTLGSRKPSVVVASPLRRALQTAQPVADVRPRDLSRAGLPGDLKAYNAYLASLDTTKGIS